jgi:hypothetical protein
MIACCAAKKAHWCAFGVGRTPMKQYQVGVIVVKK